MPIPILITPNPTQQSWRREAELKRRHWRPNGKRPDWRHWMRRLLVAAGLGALGLVVVGLVAVLWVSASLPDPNKLLDRVVPLSTKIYDRTGKVVLYDVYGVQRRTQVELTALPPHLITATLAAEDREFYTHRGFRLKSFLRAIWANLSSSSRQGGSTITQQLVKNAILTPEKTYTRKLKELILSIQIERTFTKDQILKMYFNEIPYGGPVYGAAAAAEYYFGKPVGELSLAESAILAALPQSPSRLSPYGPNRDLLIARQHWILDSMVDLGQLKTEEAKTAKTEEVTFQPPREQITAPHFVFYIRNYLSQRFGEQAVEQGGLKVVTTLDLDHQGAAEKAVVEGGEKNAKQWGASNAALVSLDAKTGEILAMVGSRDYFDEDIDGQVNVVTRPRQPGSSFKPIVYAAAFRRGFQPETILYDVVTSFPNADGKPYEPHNYNDKEHGPVSMRSALAGSLNIPAVKTLYLAGIGNVLDLADELGYTTLTQRSRFGLSLVLGGGEVKLLEHVGAYSAFAQDGTRVVPAGVLKVEDSKGNLLEEFKPKRLNALEPQVARQVANVLSDNNARSFIFGATSALILPDRPVGAKTGTTNDYRDAWTIGFTPTLVAGVWVGNNDNTEMKRGADGSVVAAPIWQNYLKAVTAGTPVTTFTPPDPAPLTNPALAGGLTSGVTVIIDRSTGKLATDLTPPSLREERTYRAPHSILHFVNPDDPTGPPPTNPAADPQYSAWESAVQRWATEQGIIPEAPPTEVDDAHVPANAPTVQILNPIANQRIDSREVTVAVSVSAPRGVSRVTYELSGRTIGTVRQYPFTLVTTLEDPSLINGFATLRATAYDDIDNQGTHSIDINLMLPALPPALEWRSPAAGTRVSAGNFPLRLELGILRPTSLSSVNLTAISESGESIYLNTLRQFSSVVSTPWTAAPPPGTYRIRLEVTTQGGGTYQGPETSVVVE